MLEILPNKDELKPIVSNSQTFSETVFKKKFHELNFHDQLQVVNNIVRQSMIGVVNTNPDVDVKKMIGNCHTASQISIQYLKKLGIGTNYRYVLAKKRSFDPSDYETRHALVLVDDEYGETYQFDATPFIGYGYGQVRKSNERI